MCQKSLLNFLLPNPRIPELILHVISMCSILLAQCGSKPACSISAPVLIACQYYFTLTMILLEQCGSKLHAA
jgi:hypothetical protein